MSSNSGCQNLPPLCLEEVVLLLQLLTFWRIYLQLVLESLVVKNSSPMKSVQGGLMTALIMLLMYQLVGLNR
jgi:hypothetical protein